MLNENGIVDSKTLLAIDAKLGQNSIYDYENKKYVGQVDSTKGVIVKTTLDPDNNKIGFNVIIGNHKIFIEGTLIGEEIINSNPEFQNKTQIRPYDTSLKVINENSYVKAINKENEQKGNTPKKHFEIANAILDEMPPQQFEDQNAKIYKIQPGDTPTKIVLDNYYGGGGYPIMDPYNKTVIYTLPERTPFSVENRSEDARFQFYMNLIYYYNSEQIDDKPLKEWGIKSAGGYERYFIDHLDEVNIFDNKFDANTPETALPNYYRFLKRMENKNPNSKIIFDAAGNSTSFTTVVGKNIIIPSRQFADSMYNFVNFRHDKMFVPVVIPGWLGASPRTRMEYAVGQVLDSVIDDFSDAIDNVVGIFTELKNDTIELYYETAAFIKKAYEFASLVLTSNIPRGAGGKVGYGGSVTVPLWGVPTKIKGNAENSIYRKMSKQDDLIFVYNTSYLLGAGVSSSVGYSYGIGKYAGLGKSKKEFGVLVGASATADIDVNVSTEYEFPITRDDTALLAMIINVFCGDTVKSMTKILSFFDIINLDSKQYISKMKMAIDANVIGKIGAEIGVSKDNNEDPDIQDENKSHGLIDNIFSFIPGMGASSEANFNNGVSFSYKVDYGDNPFDKNHNRVFEIIELDINYHVQKSLKTELLGSFFQKLFVNFSPIGSFVNTIFDLMSFDKGFILGAKYKLQRTDGPNSLSHTDFSFVSPQILNKKLVYDTDNTKLKKETSLYFGMYSGDVNTLCEDGSEVKYYIDMEVLQDMWNNLQTYDYNFVNVIKLFKSIEYHKKVGFTFDQAKTKKIIKNENVTNQVVGAFGNKNQSNPPEVQLTTAILAAALDSSTSKKIFLNGGLALDMKMTIDTEILTKVFECYSRKLYLKYVLFRGNKPSQLKIDQDFNNKKDEIIKSLGTINGELYYNTLYTRLLLFVNTKITAKLQLEPELNNIERPFLIVIEEYVKSIKLTDSYMNNNQPPNNDLDYGISQILDFFSFITDLGQLEVTLEAKAGLSLGGFFKAGAVETVGLSLEGLAEINYQGLLYEKGELTDLLPGDLLWSAFQKIEKVLGLPSANKRIGAKTAFGVLKK